MTTREDNKHEAIFEFLSQRIEDCEQNSPTLVIHTPVSVDVLKELLDVVRENQRLREALEHVKRYTFSLTNKTDLKDFADDVFDIVDKALQPNETTTR